MTLPDDDQARIDLMRAHAKVRTSVAGLLSVIIFAALPWALISWSEALTFWWPW